MNKRVIKINYKKLIKEFFQKKSLLLDVLLLFHLIFGYLFLSYMGFKFNINLINVAIIWTLILILILATKITIKHKGKK
jgi:hypothetical protein